MKKAHKCFGVKSKNAEQQIAIDALLDPSVDLVIMEGTAGSGKTLLALAAGLEHVLETKSYKEILFTRAPVGVGNDMGFLPGNETEKMAPWCGALQDNMQYLIGDSKLTDAIMDTKVKIKAMMFMRGRSLMGKWLIIDEAQNLSLNELKVLLTRVGENTKVIVLGDGQQVDNKKLSVTNNAIYHLGEVAKSQQYDYIKYIHLPTGERSRICTWAAENL